MRKFIGRLLVRIGTRLAGESPAPDRRIVLEVYKAAESLGAKSDLLGLIGSWGDSLPDPDVLEGLREWNAGGDGPAT